ncbi:MAG: S-methyl-5-thioribose-1-phosphate isomerase [Phycisphaera sp.]|nr:S-methyl-5-thioribose-1-phosphate isomerase [Phycisphaera sp.]
MTTTNHNRPATIEWVGDAASGHLRLIDQTKLPGALEYLDCQDVGSVWHAIKRLSVRGAPAIGVSAAYGCVIGAQAGTFGESADYLATSRPTAVNLFWAIDRMKGLGTADPARLLDEAKAIHAEDAAMCDAIGRNAMRLIKEGGGVLTHCNAGALATAGIGTATAPMYTAHDAGRKFRVYADETRPLLQGARLTAWELQQAGIDVTLICDNMAASVMREGKIDVVITGADRIARNGDAANKIGTYNLAVLARHHGIPFYIAAPTSTFDLACPSGADIPIEQREPAEVQTAMGHPLAPADVKVYNPAFDVTPAELITAIITEKGVIEPVTEDAVRGMVG